MPRTTCSQRRWNTLRGKASTLCFVQEMWPTALARLGVVASFFANGVSKRFGATTSVGSSRASYEIYPTRTDPQNASGRSAGVPVELGRDARVFLIARRCIALSWARSERHGKGRTGRLRLRPREQ